MKTFISSGWDRPQDAYSWGSPAPAASLADSELFQGQQECTGVEGPRSVPWSWGSQVHLPFGLGSATHLLNHFGFHLLVSISLGNDDKVASCANLMVLQEPGLLRYHVCLGKKSCYCFTSANGKTEDHRDEVISPRSHRDSIPEALDSRIHSHFPMPPLCRCTIKGERREYNIL